MLSGAILGGIFASPPVLSILAAIRAVTLPTSMGGKGCLLIVKNYTGDRLNFGMACEMAQSEGYAVSMVIVADDCAVERTKGITGARGVAGTIWVHKAAGGAAGEGTDLEAVTTVAKTVAESIGSLGVAFEAVTIPGAVHVNDRLSEPNDKGESMMEVGLGIHGEAGMRQCPILSCDNIAKEMLNTIQSYGKEFESKILPLYKAGDELIVMVNNMGGTSNFEMSLLVRSLITQLENSTGCKVTRVMVGSFMTSFDMQGASVSIMPLTGDAKNVITFIDADTDAPAWSKIDTWRHGALRPSSIEIAETSPPVASANEATAMATLPPVLVDNFSGLARNLLSHCSQAIINAEPILTKYDTIVGDGDCGMTMERGAKEILQRLELRKVRLDHPSSLFSDLADAVSASMGGTSGILLELLFRKASTSLQQLCAGEEGITSKTLATAFQAGVKAISFYGGAQEGSRTMLDALFPASAAMFGKENSAIIIHEAAVAAREGADATAKMDRAEAGRSNYLAGGVLMGTPDPGAVAVAVVFEAMAEIMSQ